MKEIKELTAKELVLVEMLQKATREHPVTRQVLRQTFGNDRKCRDMIANIRKKRVSGCYKFFNRRILDR